MRRIATVRLIAPRLLALAGTTVVLSACLGLASSLSTTTNKVGQAAIIVPRCSTAGVTTVEVLTGTTISGVAVSNLDSVCAAGTLQVTVKAGAATGAGSIAVPAGGGSATVTISPAVAFVGNAQIDTVIVGP